MNRDRCGELGKGTPGKRLKREWREDDLKVSLRSYAHVLADSVETDNPMCQLATKWLASK